MNNLKMILKTILLPPPKDCPLPYKLFYIFYIFFIMISVPQLFNNIQSNNYSLFQCITLFFILNLIATFMFRFEAINRLHLLNKMQYIIILIILSSVLCIVNFM